MKVSWYKEVQETDGKTRPVEEMGNVCHYHQPDDDLESQQRRRLEPKDKGTIFMIDFCETLCISSPI